jgi:hypothetical protein
MKIFILLMALFTSITSHALTRPRMEFLLEEKGFKARELEIQGMKIILGEVTGHLKAVQFSKVLVLITENEAILKTEIDSVDFSGAQDVGSVVAVRFNGQYVLKKDVKATVLLGH